MKALNSNFFVYTLDVDEDGKTWSFQKSIDNIDNDEDLNAEFKSHVDAHDMTLKVVDNKIKIIFNTALD